MTWHAYVVGVLLFLSTLALSFGVGWFARTPNSIESSCRPQVIEVPRVTEQHHHHYEERVVVGKSKTVTKKMQAPDGTKVTETTTESGHVTTSVGVSETKTRENPAPDTGYSAGLPPQRDWRVGLLGGVTLEKPTLVYGGKLEQRILGPVWAGAWGLSSGVVGVSLAVEF